jgi:hypothetical protein
MTSVRPVVVVADHDDERQRTMTFHTAHIPVDPNRWAALHVLCAGMPMIVLDVTIVRRLLPRHARGSERGIGACRASMRRRPPPAAPAGS